MNITTKGRYALRVMMDLADHSEDGFVSIKTVSERLGISMKYLEMIVANLKKASLLDSTRGKDGGYKLIKPAADYSVGEILRSTEENLAPVSCIKGGEMSCERAGDCKLAPMWSRLDGIMSSYLDTVSLTDLINGNIK